MLPPGGKATTKVIGPVGNSCPKPRPPSAKSPASEAAIRTARRATIVRFLPMPGRVYAQSLGAYAAAPLGRFLPVRGEQRTIWPQPRQFDYPGTALAEGAPSVQTEFFRGNAGRPRRCLV